MVALLQWRDLDEMPICPIKSWPQALNANLGSISLNRDACASLCTGCRSFIEQNPPFGKRFLCIKRALDVAE